MNKWKTEEENYLKEKWGQVVLEVIMRDLGRTEDSIARKAHRLGLQTRKEPSEYLKKRWTEQEDNLLNKFYHIKPIIELEKILTGRTKESIIKRAKSLGLNSEKRHWTEEEIAYLKEKWGISPVEKIAKKLSRTKSAVLLKAHKIGLREQAIANGEYLTPKDISVILGVGTRTVYNWMEKEYLGYRRLKINSVKKYQISSYNFIKFLKEHQEKWNSRISDMNYINACCITGRVNEVVQIPEWIVQKISADKMGKPILKRKFWTVKEVNLLKTMLGGGKTKKEIAVELKRSFFSVQSKISLNRSRSLLSMEGISIKLEDLNRESLLLFAE